MKETIIVYNLDVRPDWLNKVGKQLQAQPITGNMVGDRKFVHVLIPSQIGKGEVYCIQLDEGLAGFYVNAEYYRPYRFIPVYKQGEFITIQFSIKDTIIINQQPVADAHLIRKEINDKIIVRDGAMVTFFNGKQPVPMHALRIIMKRDYALKLVQLMLDNTSPEESFMPGKNTLFRQLDMDLRSIEILNALGNKGLDHPTFSLYFMGSVYALLANLFERLKLEATEQKGLLLATDIIAIRETHAYLMSQVEYSFPRLEVLAAMAHMSVSKYRKAFNQLYDIPPMKYFNIKKLELAMEMLISGKFSVEQVTRRLNYSNPGFFSARFSRHFGIRPGKVLRAGRNLH